MFVKVLSIKSPKPETTQGSTNRMSKYIGAYLYNGTLLGNKIVVMCNKYTNHGALCRGRDTKQYVPYDPIYMKSQKRQNYPLWQKAGERLPGAGGEGGVGCD